MDIAELRSYSIAAGGPLRAVERALRITREDRYDVLRRVGTVLALAYVPLLAVVIASGRMAQGSPALMELTTHARGLVAVPLLVITEGALEERSEEVGEYLQRSTLVAPGLVEAHRAAIARTGRLRDSWGIEAVLLLATLASTIEFPAFSRESFDAIRWSMVPAVLLYRFLALRLLWRWGLWALYLLRISRLPLELRPGHPDRAAGLEPLSGPSIAFGGLVLAGGTSVAGVWGDHIRFEGASAKMFALDALVYIVVALAVSLSPLLVFTGRLIRVRRRGLQAYGAMAKRYVDAFEVEYLNRAGEDLIGANAIQSLNDLGGSLERVQTMRVIVAPRVVIQTVLAAAVAPMLPLVVAEVGAVTLLARLAKAVL